MLLKFDDDAKIFVNKSINLTIDITPQNQKNLTGSKFEVTKI